MGLNTSKEEDVPFSDTAFCVLAQEHRLDLKRKYTFEMGRMTALQYAVRRGHHEVVTEILQSAVSVSMTCCKHIQWKDTDKVVQKIQEDLMAYSDKQENTEGKVDPVNAVVLSAIEKDSAEVVCILGHGGAYFGQAPFHFIETDNPNVTATLCAHRPHRAGPNDDYMECFLYHAVTHNWPHTVRTLCENGAVANSITDRGETLLHMAAGAGKADLVSVLCECGAKVNRKNDAQETALCRAVKWSHSQVVQILCEYGAKVNRADSKGTTPLFRIATGFTYGTGQTEVIRTLCKHGAKGDRMAAGECETPLGAAMRKCKFDQVRVLVECGADINLPAYKGTTVSTLTLAAHNHNVDDVAAILEHANSADVCNKISQEACFSSRYHAGHPGLVKLLLTQPHCDCNKGLWWSIRSIEKLTESSFCGQPFREHLQEVGEAVPKTLKIIQMFVQAGSSVNLPFDGRRSARTLPSFLYSSESILVHGAATMATEFKKPLADGVCECLRMMLSAGCHVTAVDFELMNSDVLRPVLEAEGIQQYALNICEQPISLKRLCKLTVRGLARKPLTVHIPRSGLAPGLQKYLFLELPD